MTRDTTTRKAGKKSLFSLFLKIGLPLLIVAFGAVSAYSLYANRPVAKRGGKSAASIVPLVRVVRAQTGAMPARVDAAGTVRAAREIDLKPRVAGRVEHMAPGFTPGGVLRKGDMVLKLDQRDFQLAVAERTADVTKAQADLDIEMGQQYVAREEWKHLLGEKTLKTTLALRKPQLAQAKATLASAQAALQKAQLELARTTVYAPFNALVTDRRVDVGSQVSTQDTLATLSGTDEYWIEISVPMDRLRWIDIPPQTGTAGKAQRGSEVSIDLATGTRTGRVLRLLGALQEDSRMARVLVSVADPLNLQRPSGSEPPLILGDYVTVTVLGRQVRDAVRIPRMALREGDTVWIVRDGTMHISPVSVVWKNRDEAFIDSGLAAGDTVVASNVSSPVEGMALRVDAASECTDTAANCTDAPVAAN